MTTPVEKLAQRSFVDSLPENVVDSQIRAIAEHKYDDRDVELVREYICRQPSEFGDSGGDMASDEIRNWRDLLWGSFVAAMVGERRVPVAIEAMAEIENKEIRQRAALAVSVVAGMGMR